MQLLSILSMITRKPIWILLFLFKIVYLNYETVNAFVKWIKFDVGLLNNIV